MSKNHLLILAFLLLIFFAGCVRPMDRSVLGKYIAEPSNGLTKVSSYPSGLKVSISLIRPELLPFKKGVHNTLKYFMISLSKDGREALPQFNNAPNYAQLNENLSFSMPQYSRLIVDSKDTVQALNYFFTNMYGLAPANNLLLVFKARTPTENYKLELDEIGLKTGNNQLIVSKSSIEKLYAIQLK